MKSIADQYIIEPLNLSHDRGTFTCGVPGLDRYLKEQATQDAKRNVAAIFTAVHIEIKEIHGYYTLSMASVAFDLLPEDLARKMPRYPSIPAVRLGRLAVNVKVKGRGLGVHMLMDSMKRSLKSEVAWAAFIVDAKDKSADSFYKKFGFLSFPDNPKHLFIMRKTIESLFK